MTTPSNPTPNLGPRPLPMHLAVQTLALMSSLAALPLLKNGSPSWSPALNDIANKIAEVPPEAFLKALSTEAARRFETFVEGVQIYQNAPRAERPPEPCTVWQSGAARLLDYGEAGNPPLLVVPSLINRGYVLDLSEKRSLMRYLADQGFRPLLLDWGTPGAEERAYDLDAYITGPLQQAFDFVATTSKTKPALVGYCMGGTLALALAARNLDQVSALVLLATPWDFQAGQEAYLPVLAAMLPGLEVMIETLGVLPVDVLQAIFAGLNPMGVGMKFRALSEMPASSAKAQAFLQLEDWLNDGVPLAGPVARQCLSEWYLQNKPAEGEWQVAGTRVDPARIDCPTLVVVPEADYIVPPEGAKPLAKLIPDAKLKTVKAGHIGMVAGGGARAKLYTPLSKWLNGALN